MEFINPTALYSFLALPLLLVPYLIRRRPRRVVFSTLLFFGEARSRVTRSRWQRLRLPPTFFLQLLLLSLLILALSEPVFSVRPTKIAIVLDNSASMQTLEGESSRFALAQREVRAVLGETGASAGVDLYLTVPALEKVTPAAISATEAERLIERLAPYDLPDLTRDYSDAMDQMIRTQNYDRVYFISDHPAQGQSAAIRAIKVGEPKGNFAVSAFELAGSSLVSSRREARIEVSNFSARDERVVVALKSSDGTLSSREVVVRAGGKAAATFEGFPSRPFYTAEIATNDALPLDNRRFAVGPPSQTMRVLGISPRPQALGSLRAIPGLSLDLISPSEYTGAPEKYAIEIFQYSAPAALPDNPAVFILPPDENPLVELGKPVSRPLISKWSESHPLTRYVNFALFRLPYARALKVPPLGEVILQSPDGPIAFVVERNARQYLVLGFDPFPYLGGSNLPVSIFTLNFLDWFFEHARSLSRATGEPLNLGVTQPGDLLERPDGEKVTLGPGISKFSATFRQGIYQLIRGGKREYFAANLEVASESDLREPVPVQLGKASVHNSSPSIFFSFWPYLLGTTLLVSLIEWFFSPGDRLRSTFRSQPAKS